MKKLSSKKLKQKSKPRVLLAMSGGVDSSIAAYLLKKKSYEVIGAFIKSWSDTKNHLGECHWREERRVASQIASILDIKLITLDFEKEYKKQVVNEMFNSYRKGITPNPDIDCNNKVKFPLLWKAAKNLHAVGIATGHYARIKKIVNKNKYELHRAKDESKDQSYFLYRLNQKDLSHTLFPIGSLTKKQVREMAKKIHFPNYDKKSTTGICFIGKINLKTFLSKKIKQKKGKILDPNGNIIGEHDGVYFYTIGQRLGPRYGFNIEKNLYDSPQQLKKWYIAKKIAKKNIIIAAPENHKLLFRKELIIKNIHFISDNPNNFKNKPKKVNARIRHVGELLPAILKFNKNKKQYNLTLNKPITGVSEGQACVLYALRNSKVLGGGVIGF